MIPQGQEQGHIVSVDVQDRNAVPGTHRSELGSKLLAAMRKPAGNQLPPPGLGVTNTLEKPDWRTSMSTFNTPQVLNVSPTLIAVPHQGHSDALPLSVSSVLQTTESQSSKSVFSHMPPMRLAPWCESLLLPIPVPPPALSTSSFQLAPPPGLVQHHPSIVTKISPQDSFCAADLLSSLGEKDSIGFTESFSNVEFHATSSTERNSSNTLLGMLKSKTEDNPRNQPTENFSTIQESPPADLAVVAPIGKKVLHFRTTKNECGILSVSVRNFKGPGDMKISDSYFLRPGTSMKVTWMLPDIDFPPTARIVIALLRYGSPVNIPSIVAKSAQFKQGSVSLHSTTSQLMRCGTVQFFAPKSAGQFVFRLFDESSRESSYNTLATSVQFSVVLMDGDIVNNLQHVIDAFDEKLPTKAIAQFSTIVKGIKSCSSQSSSDVSNILNLCVKKILDAVHSTIPIIEEGDLKKKLSANDSPLAEDGEGSKGERNASVEEFWKEYRLARRVSSEGHDALEDLVSKKASWYLVTEKLKNDVIFVESLFCPILKRHFRNNHELVAQRVSDLGFLPASLIANTVQRQVFQAIDRSINNLLPSLLPSEDFFIFRENIRFRVENYLKNVVEIPENSHLEIFGSSANGFGSDGADIDMCLVLSNNASLTHDQKANLIHKIGDALISVGMSAVNMRTTARIPIVQFVDNMTGKACDISLHNPLAVANTRLLRIYSTIDPRVRSLAFIVKNWAKKRSINSPQDGTLSSYGFVLTILHFLQHRPVPIIPVLQSLPPTWPATEESIFDQGQYMTMHPLDSISCNTYYLTPSIDQYEMLRKISSTNKETLSELLVEYFRYFAWKFDFRNEVVSIRTIKRVLKHEKYEKHCWFHTDNMSIEDPFETWYDVAHVIKSNQMSAIRKEYLRAFTALCRSFQSAFSPSDALNDGLPAIIDPDAVVGFICSESHD